MNPYPKVFLKLQLGLSEKQQAHFKNLERGGETTNKKGRPLGETLRKDNKNHLDVF
jgi:hypothetical protein